MATPYSLPSLPTESEASKSYRLNRDISLSNQEIQTALRAAVLAKAEELAMLGKVNIPALSLDAQMETDTNRIESVGVVATVEVLVPPAAMARLLREEFTPTKEAIVLTDELTIEKPSETRGGAKNLVSKALEKLSQG